jgi:hypothetical protein
MRLPNLSTRTLLIGLAIAAGTFVGIRYVFSPIIDPLIRTGIVLAGAVAGALAGGYYAGRQPGSQKYPHALLIAVLDIAVLVMLRLLPWDLTLAALMLVAALGGVIWAERMPVSAVGTPFTPRRGYSSIPSPAARRVVMPIWLRRLWDPFRRFFSKRRSEQVYGQLLRRVRMDQDLADRLIDFERRRNPYANREMLIRNALERLERDNR